jgi:hypothetical protein
MAMHGDDDDKEDEENEEEDDEEEGGDDAAAGSMIAVKVIVNGEARHIQLAEEVRRRPWGYVVVR